MKYRTRWIGAPAKSKLDTIVRPLRLDLSGLSGDFIRTAKTPA